MSHTNYGRIMRSRLLVVFAAMCFATTGTSQELGPDDAPSLSVASIRLIIGAIALLFISAILSKRAGDQPSPVAIPIYTWLLAGFGMALYGATFFAAVRSTGVAVGTVVALGSAPLLTGVLSAMLLRTIPARTWLLANTIATCGMATIVLAGQDAQVSTRGVLFALGAGLGYAIFAISSKLIITSGVSSERAMSRIFTIAASMLAPALLFTDLHWLATGGGILLALWLGVVTVALAYWAYASGLRHLAPSDATTLTLVEPVAASMLGVVALSERPTLLAWVGMVMVIGALVYESRTPMRDGTRGTECRRATPV